MGGPHPARLPSSRGFSNLSAGKQEGQEGAAEAAGGDSRLEGPGPNPRPPRASHWGACGGQE